MQDSTHLEDKKARNRKANKIILPIFGVLLVAIIFGVIVGSGSGKAAKYSATIDTNSMTVVNPATLAVTIHVTNNGNADGKPQCTINVNDTNYTYTGADLATLDTVKAGKTATAVDKITITKQGAQYVTAGKISCR